MKRNVSSIVWGILLILAGVALLADRLGWIDFNLISTNSWVFIFAGLSLVFFLSYILNGIREWGWLFPALIFAALSLTVWMVDRGLSGSFLGTPILLSISLPFFVGFAIERKAWGLLIPAWILFILAVITLTADVAEGTLIGALFLYAVAAPFLVVFLLDHTRWWALIPAWITLILGTITLLSEHVDGNLIGALFMYGVALPFLVIYLRDRSQRWALIPAIITAILGTIPLFSSFIGGDWLGALVMLLFSAPFFYVYFHWKENWWALIPAGIFTSIGLVVLLGMLVPVDQPFFEGLLTGLLLLGFGATFGILWLQKTTRPTAWARYPAGGLLVAAVLAFFLRGDSDLFWPIGILAAGTVLVIYSFLRKKPEKNT